MKYRDTNNKPFVLLDVDKNPDLDLHDVAALIADSKTYPAPAVWWQDGDEAFGGAIAQDGKPGLVLTPDEIACKEVSYAVKLLRRAKGSATFLITTTFSEVPSFDTDSLRENLQSTIRHVQDGGGKRLVLITSGGKVEERHPGLMAALHQFNPALPVVERPQTIAMPGRADLRTAMASAAPPDFQTEWDWADNPQWRSGLTSSMS